MSKSERYTNTIAIARTDAIGDCIMTLPLCGILKKNFPSSRLIFIGSAYTQSIIECDTDVDEFIDWTALKDKPLTQSAEFLRLKHIDTLIFAFPNKQLAKISKKAGIPVRIATSHRLYNWLYCNKLVNFSRKNSDKNEAQLNTELLSPLIAKKEYSLQELSQNIHFTVPQTDCRQKDLLKPDKFNVILHPKSRGSAREWPAEYYQQLITLLDDRFRVFVCGTAEETKGLSLTGSNVIDLTGTMTLQEYIDFISRADALVACSTGPLHIASVSGIHALGLFPPMKNINLARWQPLGRNVKVFCFDNPECVQCRKGGICTCMQKITPRQVARYLTSLI